MAKRTDIPDDGAYSSGVKKVLILGKDGRTMASDANPLSVDAIISVDTLNLKAEMKVDSGHDLYLIDTVTVTGDYSVSFPPIPGGLDVLHVQAFENKTKGGVYITAGATVTATTIELVESKQTAETPKLAVGDEIEIVFRGPSRLTDREQITKLASVPVKKITDEDLSVSDLDYTTNFGLTTKLQSVLLKFSGAVDQKVTITLKSGDGANYDTILRDDELTNMIDYFWQPDGDIIITENDELQVTCTNTGTPAITVYVTILGEIR